MTLIKWHVYQLDSGVKMRHFFTIQINSNVR